MNSKPSVTPDFSGKPEGVTLVEKLEVPGLGHLKFRPIRLDDEPGMVHFHSNLLEENVFKRYFQQLSLNQRTGHQRMIRICTNTPDSYAIIAVTDVEGVEPTIEGVGRLTKTPQEDSVSFDMLITNRDKQHKLANVMLSRLIDLARGYGFIMITGEFLLSDQDVLDLCRDLGFSRHKVPLNGVVRVSLNL